MQRFGKFYFNWSVVFYTIFVYLFVLCCLCLAFEKMKENELEVVSSNFSLLGWSCIIQMMISLPGTANEGLQTQNLFPLYIFLVRLVYEVAVVKVRMHVLISYLKWLINLYIVLHIILTSLAFVGNNLLFIQC